MGSDNGQSLVFWPRKQADFRIKDLLYGGIGFALKRDKLVLVFRLVMWVDVGYAERSCLRCGVCDWYCENSPRAYMPCT